MEQLTRSEMVALTTRGDLLEAECQLKRATSQTWQGRAESLGLGRYGRSGGSAADRLLIVRAMAKIERAVANDA